MKSKHQSKEKISKIKTSTKESDVIDFLLVLLEDGSFFKRPNSVVL